MYFIYKHLKGPEFYCISVCVSSYNYLVFVAYRSITCVTNRVCRSIANCCCGCWLSLEWRWCHHHGIGCHCCGGRGHCHNGLMVAVVVMEMTCNRDKHSEGLIPQCHAHHIVRLYSTESCTPHSQTLQYSVMHTEKSRRKTFTKPLRCNLHHVVRLRSVNDTRID